MTKILIFTDAATSPQLSIAIGAFLCLDSQQLNEYAECSKEDLHARLSVQVKYQNYNSKKSTWSEIKTAIDALNFILKDSETNQEIEIYTDCKSLCDLLNRRKEKLQRSNYITSTGKVLANADLYKELFSIADKFKIQTFKIKGHNPDSKRVTTQEKIFSILDKLSRTRLRLDLAKFISKTQS